ncbi:MAG: FAD binding domain-containing protein [Xanthobacteraceae bacterium]
MLVDLRKLSELQQIKIGQNGVTLGAMVRWSDILEDVRLREAHPLMVAAIEQVAHYQIRNRGTVGGDLAHADPAAEMPGIVVTCEAEIAVIGKACARVIAAKDFFHGPLMTALKVDEIITEIRFPPWSPGRRFGCCEFARRRGDFALAAAALFYDRDGDGGAQNTHVGAIGVADMPLRLSAVENVLNGQKIDQATIAKAEAAASAAVDPADDIHATGAYRKSLIGSWSNGRCAKASLEPGPAATRLSDHASLSQVRRIPYCSRAGGAVALAVDPGCESGRAEFLLYWPCNAGRSRHLQRRRSRGTRPHAGRCLQKQARCDCRRNCPSGR